MSGVARPPPSGLVSRLAVPASPGLSSADLPAALLDVLQPAALGGVQHEVAGHRNRYRGGDHDQRDPRIDEQQDETDDDATDRNLHPTRHVSSSRPKDAVFSRSRPSPPHPGLYW